MTSSIKVLAVDTATPACSAALLCDGVLHQRFEVAPRAHNRLLFEMCASLFADTGLTAGQLEALVFGCGPGAFTGVRIAAAFTQGVAFAHHLPVVPVSSLRALAQQMMDRHQCRQVLAMMDARMGEVYYGYFQRDADALAQNESQEALCKPDAVPVSDDFSGGVCGSGFAVYAESLSGLLGSLSPTATDGSLLPDAAAMIKLALPEIKAGRTLNAAQAMPVYLRNQIAVPARASHGGRSAG